MKRCWGCNIEKSLEEFSICRSSKDGRQGLCKECDRERRRKWRLGNKEREKTYAKEWAKRNKDKVAERQRKYRERYPDRVKAQKLRYKQEHYEEVLEQSRRWKRKNIERQRLMWRAAGYVKRALKKGILERPEFCEECGKRCKPEAAHYSYEKGRELDIKWLCRSCHIKWDQNDPKSKIS